MKEVLNNVFRLQPRFNMEDDFGKYIRSLFKDYFIYDDDLYSAPIGKFDINTILKDWENFMKSQGLKYSLIPEIDCDDYARMFQEFVVFKYRWNLCGRLWGLLGILEKDNKIHFYGHAFNWIGIPLLYDETRGIAYIWFIIVEPQLATFAVPKYSGDGIIHLSNSFLVYKPYIALG